MPRGNRLLDPGSGNPLVDQMGGGVTWADAAQQRWQQYQAYVAQQRAEGIARGELDPATGWPTQAGLVEAARSYGNALLGSTSAPGIRAFHGSPHSFDRFDLSKIGSGEGAQAFGHGLYFAEREGTAQAYRQNLSGSGVDIVRGGDKIGKLAGNPPVNDPEYVKLYNSLIPAEVPGWIKSGVLRDIKAAGEAGKNVDLGAARQASVDRMTREMAQFNPESQARAVAEVHKAYDSIGDDVQFRAPGSMYEVAIKADPEAMLHWDKPISEQSDAVKAALAKLPWAEPYLKSDLPGSQLAPTTAEGAAQFREAGIPGIRYADAGSRGQEGGTSNYVVFDDKMIDILRKYGIAGLTAAGIANPFGGQPAASDAPAADSPPPAQQ